MNVNQVLMQFFKLPPAMRMILALAGFGSLATVLFAVVPQLGTARGRFTVLIIGGIGLLIYGVIWLIRRAIGGKRAKTLSGALATQGPTRGDIAEQESIYREKFRAKLNELRTNGLSVYKLPWFILMGEPGCGKTASLIHSGLDFPLGKDEVPGFGGTRNYNWWFTNEAVILDTAGRIAFHEEGTTDKVEWEYFIKLLKSNRPRCPINGIVIALPADKLLRDSAEERAQKASILRDRLRQVHQLLGIRFPTFVLVTKMDLVGGFNEFFEEVRVDLQQRNQMVGWSRPGTEFQTPYDPADFPSAFDGVYRRLRDWAMRYLQRKATDDELGLVVTFPEAFRAIGQALGDYIGTIFQKSPLLEPPFFRGFYFTSAVQEGAPIFDVLARATRGLRLDDTHPRAVDSKAFFIHDFYDKKVFPEQGLVFRSAKHVTVNRRMRWLVGAGTTGMSVALLAFVLFGYFKVADLIRNPRNDCAAAVGVVEKKEAITLAGVNDALALSQKLRGHVEAYGRPMAGVYARMLFLGASISKPREYVETVHARHALESLLRPVLAEVEARLAQRDIPLSMPPDARKRHLEALRVYALWYGQVAGRSGLAALADAEAPQRAAEIEALAALLELAEGQPKQIAGEVELALRMLSRESRSFALQVLEQTLGYDKPRATRTLVAALGKLTESWRPLTEMKAGQADPFVRYWADFVARISALRQRYDQLLAQAEDLKKPDAFAQASERVLTLAADAEAMGDPKLIPAAGSVAEAYAALLTFLNGPPPHVDRKIIRLNEVLEVLAKRWNDEFGPIERALRVGAPQETAAPQAEVYGAIAAARQSLNQSLVASVAGIREALGLRDTDEPLGVLVTQKLLTFNDVTVAGFADPQPSIRIAREALGVREHVWHYMAEIREIARGGGDTAAALNDLREWPKLLSGTGGGGPASEYLKAWFDGARTANPAEREALILSKSGFAEQPFWKPRELYSLADAAWGGQLSTRVARLLTQMATRADATVQERELPGLARLIPEFDRELPSELPFALPGGPRGPAAVKVEPTPTAAQPPPQPATRPGRDDLRRGGAAPPPSATTAPVAAATQAAPTPRERTLRLTRYHTREILAEALRARFDVNARLADQPAGKPVLEALERASVAYIDAYFSDWSALYNDYPGLLDGATLELLRRCRDGLPWSELHALVAGKRSEISAGTAARFDALLRHALAFDLPLGRDERDNALVDWIQARRDVLDRSGKSPPDKLPGIRDAMTQQRDPEAGVRAQMVAALSTLLGGIEAAGADLKAGLPPDRAAVTKDIDAKLNWSKPRPGEFAFLAPYFDLVDYSRRVAQHELLSRLVRVLQPAVGHPLLGGSGGGDIGPLLKNIGQFQREFEPILSALPPDAPERRTLERCAEWTRFLFGEGGSYERAPQLRVRVAIIEPPAEVLNAGARYNRIRIRLPLLQNGAPAPEIVRPASVGALPPFSDWQREAKEFDWSTSGTGGEFTAIVGDRNPMLTQLPEEIRMGGVPNDPWRLLLGTSASGGVVRLPIRGAAGADQIGFDIVIQFVDKNVPGGPIPAIGSPGPPPKMDEAAKYLERRGI